MFVMQQLATKPYHLNITFCHKSQETPYFIRVLHENHQVTQDKAPFTASHAKYFIMI